ncbi:MAG: NAD-dependent epimerase/dehydratase family protein [Spirochaetia bacterium]|nr:NAD-dependent epimerase/dehydratase family protein [Spirochaetia bacterium]
MKILILGASGFLGKSIIRKISPLADSLTLFDMYFTKEQRNKYNCVVGDFSNPGDLESVIKDGVDTVIHLISTTVPSTSNKCPAADVSGNLITTINLLDICVKKGVSRIIFPSSGGTVYGEINRPAKENDPCRPICSYGIVKKTIEEYLYLYNELYGLDYRILRISNPYGSGQVGVKPQGAIGTFLHRILDKKPIEIWGDGSVIRDYIYVDDVANAFYSIVKYEGEERIFNVGTGIGHSLNDLIDIIENIVGNKVLCNYTPKNVTDVHLNILDISKITDIVGWQPITSLDEGIENVYRKLVKEKKQKE